MSFRNLSALLFVAACGGGGTDKPVVLVDGNNPPPTSNNSANDMVLVTFEDHNMITSLTSQDDQPDNQAAPLEITAAGAFKLSGESGLGGDASDEYVERDTFLIHTADVDQLSIRLAWDDGQSDHDYALFEEPAADATDLVLVSSGTIIGNVKNEFETVPVKPNTNYWLWSGVYQSNGPDDGTAPGAAPTLPSSYDLSLYGEKFNLASVGACTFTEAADGTNDHLSTGVPAGNKPEVSGQAITNNTAVFCGAINKGHFVVDPQDATTGTVDVDAFSLAINLETDVKVTLTGTDAASQTALAGLQGVEYLILNDQKQFFARGFFENTHGVLTTKLPLSTEMDTDPQSPTNGMIVGPKSIAIIAANGADIPANISYKLEVATDAPDTRAPRVTAAANVSEAHDN